MFVNSVEMSYRLHIEVFPSNLIDGTEQLQIFIKIHVILNLSCSPSCYGSLFHGCTDTMNVISSNF